MQTEYGNKIKELTRNIQDEFKHTYDTLSKYMYAGVISMQTLADYLELERYNLDHPERFSEKTQKDVFLKLKKLDIDKLAKWFLTKNTDKKL